MAERIAYLQAVVGADISSFRYAMQRVRNDVGILGAGINRVSEAARLATYTISAPLALVGASFSKAAIQFDAAMRDVNSKALLTESQLQNLRTEVLSYSNEVRAGATQVAEALAVVYGAGVKNQAEATEIMKAALKASEATVASVETTTEAVVSILNSFGRETMTAAKASDALVQLFQDGIGEMGSFANGVARLNPQIVALGITIEEAYAAYAYLTQAGLGASEASTALNQAFVGLVKPTEAMKSALQQLGVQSGTQLIHKFGGLMEALRQLSAVSGITADDVNAIFGNVRGARAAQILFNNLDRASEMVVEFQKNVDGATDRSWEQQMKSMSAQLDLLNSAFQNLAIRMGDVQFPIMEPIVKGFTNFVKALGDADIQTMQYATTIGALIIAIPPVTWFLTSMATAASLVSLAVVGIATAIASNFLGIRDRFMDTINAMTGGLGEVYEAFKRIVDFAFNEPIDPPEITPVDGDVLVNSTMSFTVDTKSIYDQWKEELSDQLSWTEFWELIKDQPTGIGDTVTFQLPVSIEPITPTVSNQRQTNAWLDYINNWFDVMNGTRPGPSSMVYQGAFMDFYAYEPPEKTFFDRIIEAFKKELPNFEAELFRIGTSVKEYFTKFFNRLGISLSRGQIPGFDFRLSDVLFNVLTFDPNDVLQIAGNSAFGQAINRLFTGIGDYIINTGLPELSRMSGMLAARLVLFINDAIQLASRILSGGDPSELLTTLGDSFVEGFNKVMDERKGEVVLPSGFQISTSMDGGNVGAELANSFYLALMSVFTASAIFQKLLPLGMLLVGGLKSALLAALSYFGIGQLILGALGLEFQEMNVENIAIAIGVGLIATKIALGLKTALMAALKPGGGVFSARSIGTSVATAGGLTLITGLVASMFGDVDPAALAVEFGALVGINIVADVIAGVIGSKIGEKFTGGAAAGVGTEIATTVAEEIASEIAQERLDQAIGRLRTPEPQKVGPLTRLANAFKSFFSNALGLGVQLFLSSGLFIKGLGAKLIAALTTGISGLILPVTIAAAALYFGTVEIAEDLKIAQDDVIIEMGRIIVENPEITMAEATEQATQGVGWWESFWGGVFNVDFNEIAETAFAESATAGNKKLQIATDLYLEIASLVVANPTADIDTLTSQALNNYLTSPEAETDSIALDFTPEVTFQNLASIFTLSEEEKGVVTQSFQQSLDSVFGGESANGLGFSIPDTAFSAAFTQLYADLNSYDDPIEVLNVGIESLQVAAKNIYLDNILYAIEQQADDLNVPMSVQSTVTLTTAIQDAPAIGPALAPVPQGTPEGVNVPTMLAPPVIGNQVASQIASHIETGVAAVAAPYPTAVTLGEPVVSFTDSFTPAIQETLSSELALANDGIMPHADTITIGVNTVEFTSGFTSAIQEAVQAEIQNALDDLGRDSYGGPSSSGAQGTSKKATGGMLNANQPYIVGEAGRELFIPNTAGKLIPAFRTNEMIRSMRSSGNANTTVNVVINGVQNVDQFVSEMRRRGYDIGRR